ncbi:MAG: S-layer homology domain-containing protein [Schaedlerella sp.]|nr:S-layer homology domain-containing protein [Lachnospiraceae bacterium]MDY4201721.1 S-layer homology domain-containing protein [Schaedlerella sp.]
MKKRFKTMLAVGLAFATILGNCVTAWADSADAVTNINNMVFVIENGEVEEQLCAEHIVIETYDNLLEYHGATKRVDDENWKYAPDSYDQGRLPFVSNCVILKVNADASFTIDAEHIVTVIQNTDSNYFYIQFDSEEAAKEAVKVMKEENGVECAVQNCDGIVGLEDPTQEPNSSHYEDVLVTDWFYEAVEALYNGDIMMGPHPTSFGPYECIARAQFALILYRMEEEPKFETEKKFSDIVGDEWYGKAVLWAAENGIVTGYTDSGRFGPADHITREQMAVMLYRYAKYKGYDLSGTADYSTFKDVDNMQMFSKDGMNWAVANGIIKGKDLDGDLTAETLQPQGNTSRAECAVMIRRFMEKYAE